MLEQRAGSVDNVSKIGLGRGQRVGGQGIVGDACFSPFFQGFLEPGDFQLLGERQLLPPGHGFPLVEAGAARLRMRRQQHG